MIRRASTTIVLSSAISLASLPGIAEADGGNAFVGGLLGSALGTAIVNHQQQRQRTVYVQRAAPAPVVNTYQREQNREVQTMPGAFRCRCRPKAARTGTS
jgi:hypothetical protein